MSSSDRSLSLNSNLVKVRSRNVLHFLDPISLSPRPTNPPRATSAMPSAKPSASSTATRPASRLTGDAMRVSNS